MIIAKLNAKRWARALNQLDRDIKFVPFLVEYWDALYASTNFHFCVCILLLLEFSRDTKTFDINGAAVFLVLFRRKLKFDFAEPDLYFFDLFGHQ